MTDERPKSVAEKAKDRKALENERVREVGDRARAEGSAHTDPVVVSRWVEPTRKPDPKRRKRRTI